MKTIIATGAAVVLIAAAGTSLGADFGRGGGRPSITLYSQPNYQGPSRNWSGDVDNLADQGFNDLAQSAKVEGRWRVCEDSKLRGRCVELSGDVPDLAAMRMTVAISSFENLRGGLDRGPLYGSRQPDRVPRFPPGPAGFSGESMDGRTASFFPNPRPGPYRNADDFCRRLGFNGAAYADDRGQLRDVLCRR
jgi:hypothetical protein